MSLNFDNIINPIPGLASGTAKPGRFIYVNVGNKIVKCRAGNEILTKKVTVVRNESGEYIAFSEVGNRTLAKRVNEFLKTRNTPTITAPLFYLFKTAQILSIWNETYSLAIEAQAIKSGDKVDSFRIIPERSYFLGFVNYSINPDDWLLIIGQYDNNWNFLGTIGFNAKEIKWLIPASEFSGNFIGGTSLYQSRNFTTNPEYNYSVSSGNFTKTVLADIPFNYNAHHLYSSVSPYYQFNGEHKFIPIPGSNNSGGEFNRIYTQSVDLPQNPQSFYSLYIDGIESFTNPSSEFIWDINYSYYVNQQFNRNNDYEWTNTDYISEILNSAIYKDKSTIPLDKTRRGWDVRANILISEDYRLEVAVVNSSNRYPSINYDILKSIVWSESNYSHSVRMMRRDDNISLYSKSFSTPSIYNYPKYTESQTLFWHSDRYYGFGTHIVPGIGSGGGDSYLWEAFSDQYVPSQGKQTPPQSQVNRSFNVNRYFKEYNNERIITKEWDVTLIDDINNRIKYFIGDSELNIENTYLATGSGSISAAELPYIFNINLNVTTLFNYNTIQEAKEYKYSRVSEFISLQFASPSDLFAWDTVTVNHSYTPTEYVKLKNLWQFISENDCFVFIRNNDASYDMYEGVATINYTIQETTVNNVIQQYKYNNSSLTLLSTQSIDAGWKIKTVIANNIPSQLTLNRKIHTFIALPYFASIIVIPSVNLASFWLAIYNKNKAIWTEDNMMIVSCAPDYAFNETEKSAEIFPMQFDGENIIFREDLLMKKPATVSVPTPPDAENYYYFDNYILYNHD